MYLLLLLSLLLGSSIILVFIVFFYSDGVTRATKEGFSIAISTGTRRQHLSKSLSSFFFIFFLNLLIHSY